MASTTALTRIYVLRNLLVKVQCVRQGPTVAEWLACSPPIRANLVRSQAESLPGFSHVGVVQDDASGKNGAGGGGGVGGRRLARTHLTLAVDSRPRVQVKFVRARSSYVRTVLISRPLADVIVQLGWGGGTTRVLPLFEIKNTNKSMEQGLRPFGMFNFSSLVRKPCDWLTGSNSVLRLAGELNVVFGRAGRLKVRSLSLSLPPTFNCTTLRNAVDVQHSTRRHVGKAPISASEHFKRAQVNPKRRENPWIEYGLMSNGEIAKDRRIERSRKIEGKIDGKIAKRLDYLASHPGEPGSIPGGVDPEPSHVGIVPDDAAGRRVFSGSSVPLPGPRPCIPALLHIRLGSPSSALAVKSRPNLFTHLRWPPDDAVHVGRISFPGKGTNCRPAHRAARDYLSEQCQKHLCVTVSERGLLTNSIQETHLFAHQLHLHSTPGPEACRDIASVALTIWKVQRTPSRAERTRSVIQSILKINAEINTTKVSSVLRIR
ncbi:hypothetical protein PR048_030743 [Dryococelus australis]|uniref:Uncharacterized protein n=1 Tax=Dryococelus australis TaxID=614101 RepID=A0ABQ9GCL1_9NEOP|nr:hypothetical protein PR048_030743 [Dryococelus australis]